MKNHDVLAYAVATEAVDRIRTGKAPWASILSPNVHITASRIWPLPDFVISDTGNKIAIAAEFKPPRQTKREYLTGLGQALAYSMDFHYSLLIIPEIADDGYPISDHIVSVLQQSPSDLSIGILTYPPAQLSPSNPNFSESHFFNNSPRSLIHPARLDNSFYAKWREMSPQETFQLLSHTYDVMRKPPLGTTGVRDTAFGLLWDDIQAGTIQHWNGGTRNYRNLPKNKAGVAKNYRNFLFHLGWTEADGKLTTDGLNALHVGMIYGHSSKPFEDHIARTLLTTGKHLILFNAITEFQDSNTITFSDETDWLEKLEIFLENKGLLKRNPNRSAAAIAKSKRQFLKAEKQLWKQLGFTILRGTRVYHPARGLIFNWERITELLQID